jgi:hypothetical protein
MGLSEKSSEVYREKKANLVRGQPTRLWNKFKGLFTGRNTYYHGTDMPSAYNIADKGLKTSKTPFSKGQELAYTSTNPAIANVYAQGKSRKGGKPAVIKFEVPKKLDRQLQAKDPAFGAHLRMYRPGKSLFSSNSISPEDLVFHAQNAAFRKTLPASTITKVTPVKQKKKLNLMDRVAW